MNPLCVMDWRRHLFTALVCSTMLFAGAVLALGAAAANDDVEVAVEVYRGDEDVSQESRVIFLTGPASLVLEPGEEKRAYVAPGEYEIMALLEDDEGSIPSQARVVVEAGSPMTVTLEIASVADLGLFGMDPDAAEAMAKMFSMEPDAPEEEVDTPVETDDSEADMDREPQPDMDALADLFGGMDPAGLDPEEIAGAFDETWEDWDLEDMDEEDMDMQDIGAMIGMLEDMGIHVPVEELAVDLSDASYAELGQALKGSDPMAADRAMEELAARGAAALPTLQSLAVHDRDAVRQRAYDSLYRMQSRPVSGEAAVTVHDLLVQGLEDPSLLVRRYAADALAMGGETPAWSVELLGRNAQADDIELRAASLRALAAAGPAAQSQEETVVTLAGDPNPAVSGPALAALGAMEASSVEAVEVVLNGTAADDAVARAGAAAALGGVAGPKERLVPAALHLLHDSSPDVRQGAAGSLADMAPHETMMIAQMLPAFHDEDSGVRRNVVRATRKASVQDLSAAVLPAAGLLTDDPDSKVRHEAALLLAAAGSEAVPRGLQALGRALDDSYGAAADAAAAALSALGSSALSVVVEGLESPNAKARTRAASVLGDMGDAAAQAVPRLLELVADDDEEDDVRAEAYFAVERITGERPQL